MKCPRVVNSKQKYEVNDPKCKVMQIWKSWNKQSAHVVGWGTRCEAALLLDPKTYDQSLLIIDRNHGQKGTNLLKSS